MDSEERIKYNMGYLHLDRRQLEIHDFFMSQAINTFPTSLLDYLTDIGEKYGMCGGVIAESVAAWIKGDEDKFPAENWRKNE